MLLRNPNGMEENSNRSSVHESIQKCLAIFTITLSIISGYHREPDPCIIKYPCRRVMYGANASQIFVRLRTGHGSALGFAIDSFVLCTHEINHCGYHQIQHGHV